MKKIWALDFGRDSVTAAVAEAKTGGALRLLGGGQCPIRSLASGDFESLGDVTEAVVSAIQDAEHRSALKCETLFYNIDDAMLESSYSTGSKTLAGEGQIRTQDVRDATETALRMIARFEKTAVYSCPTGFLIDNKDRVENPVGVFGRQLDVSMHVLLARAERLESWQKVIERSRLKRGIPVLSLLSTSYGVLSPEDYPRSLILWDLGRDYLSAALVREGSLQQTLILRSDGWSAAEITSAVLMHSKKIKQSDPAAEEIILTGDWAEKISLLERIQSQWDQPVSVRAGRAVAELCEPRQASLVGLLRVASELHNDLRSSELGKNLILGLRQKAVFLMKEYF